MEAAAKKVQLLAQRILPDRPHHLSITPDQRYRVPPDQSKVFEEFKYQRLQYMTLLSDADRGMLLTRPYYDMREEPPNPIAAKESNVKMEKKTVTKLSLSDYKNKQKKASASPTDSGTPKTDASRREATDSRIDREPKKTDAHRVRDSEASKESKAHKSRDVPNDDRSSRTEARSRPTQESNDTPEKRKRVHDADGDLRPQKRARPEASTPLDDRSRTPRDDTPKRKELHTSLDRTPQKDSKSGAASSSLPNGRSALKAALGSGANKSPVSRARGDSINGNRPSPSLSGKSKTDPSSRSAMPPLLSPLHLPNDSDSHPKDKRRRDDNGEPNRPPKPSRAEPPPPPPPKRQKSPVRLPALLSPTLPPALEEELARMKKTPTKGSTPSQKLHPPESPTSNKRPPVIVKDEEEDRKDVKDKIKEKPRNRLMVTLKYPRKISKTVQRLLALPPKKDTIKKERSVSIEPPAPPQARKRPIGSTENVGDSIAVKRPRTSEVSSSKLVTPSTPSKAATSMSRVASSNSVNTPGDGSGHTPAAPPSADRDRPQTRDVREPYNPLKIQALRERYARFSKLGTKLKHDRDMLLERKNDRSGHSSDSDSKLGVILGLETALAFMIGFRAVVDARSIESKAQDPKQWGSILPVLNVMRPELRRSGPLEALFWQIQGVIHEELLRCYWSIDPSPHAVAIIGHERGRSNAWKSAQDFAERVEDSAMRANMGPWTTVEEAVSSALRIMRRWAHQEHVSWRAEVTVSAANGTS
ncbi:unnamed protein product [Colletotrichum noveboracense]|uniref:Uncharacterized protein n=1 Tax=Colletotrichum noveboracense TaxID=2664923 RepID=A0A9W4RYM9_9PEZI|nr:hypothetical protein K456DRAFT_1745699 [Colletotrichum gloeosporioides 23]KAJ0271360.1 hypothetical protein COL940_011084 [Colletotrichum noveboracense]KAJ0292317.1 hypothetical protein CBS470a_003007 [Colletotrichum nupharicola]KAJ0322058.1 hypothetical protein Brms1b_002271 [Colletotrichum noveboracense]CAI0649731.1 unnamed protein product [Colletotrichum noveboracense]